jgi:hypothetical protein
MNCDNENTIEYKERLNTIKEDFANRSTFYDDYITKVVPNHGKMLDVFINSMPFPSDKPIRIIELGCGYWYNNWQYRKKVPKCSSKMYRYITRNVEFS